MTDLAAHARAAASAMEVKKDGLRQTQDGQWKITLTALELPSWLITARPGTRIMAALVEIGDDEQPVPHGSPAPAVPNGPNAALDPHQGAVPGRDAARERGRERYAMADDGEKAVVRAGMRPYDEDFRRWLGVDKPVDAIRAIHQRCGIKSRSELASSDRALNAFLDMEYQFRGYAEIRS